MGLRGPRRQTAKELALHGSSRAKQRRKEELYGLPPEPEKIPGGGKYGPGHVEQLQGGHASGSRADFGDPAAQYRIGESTYRWYSDEQRCAMAEAWEVLRDYIDRHYTEKWGPDARCWAYFQFDAPQSEVDELLVDNWKEIGGVNEFIVVFARKYSCKQYAEQPDFCGNCILKECCYEHDRSAAASVHWALYADRQWRKNLKGKTE